MQSSIVIVATMAALGTAQMTFSDGWEKRMPHRPEFKHPHQKVARSGGVHIPQDNELNTAAQATESEKADAPAARPVIEMTDCEMEYMEGLRYHHAAMMELQKKLMQCENPSNPLISPKENSNVRNTEDAPADKRANSFNPFGLPSRF